MIYKNDNELRLFQIGRGKEAREKKIQEEIIRKIHSLPEDIPMDNVGKSIGDRVVLCAVSEFLNKNSDFLDNFDGRKRNAEIINKELSKICKIINHNSQYCSASTKGLASRLFSLYDRNLERELVNLRQSSITRSLRFFGSSESVLGDAGGSLIARDSNF